MSDLSQHSEWLSLIEVSGPFLAEPVLKDAFPQGLEGLDGAKKKLVRQAYDEWREAIDLDDPDALKIHRAWIELVLRHGLELDEDSLGDVLKSADDLPDVKRELTEHGITLAPDFAVVDGQSASPLMLIAVYEPQIVLGEAFKQGTWSASPGERMVELCRATGVRLGLVTNGEQWMLVDAPVGAVTTFASWYGRLWAQEPITLQAFVSLLGIRRFFVDRSEQLPALLDNSLKYQDEVTDALGEQVRRAVEVLIQALDRAHVDSNRTLLEGVEPTELYEAGLTVMMRIVFLLSAEERGLLLLGDELYESNYAVSTLRLQLRAESEEILERRWDAWSRMLSLFRAVYGGIDHEALRLPALGGSLFDPDRFPFLEGRPRGSRWKVDMARPLPIDNRTVLLLLEAVQLFRGRTLSYMALDVEQIGYVYEGLLERTVVRAAEVTLDLDATKSAKNPWVTLPEIEDAAAQGQDALQKLLKERTESSASRVRNDLNRPVDDAAAEKLLTACHADRGLRDRVKPYFHFLRTDPWGYPLVYPKGTFMVASGFDRRETGTHYTPKSFTEAIVKRALEPIVYFGPAEGKPRSEWRIKVPSEILELKICDPAMGSGAFLVQTCRWLSERLVESWSEAESAGLKISSQGRVLDTLDSHEPLRTQSEERFTLARRLIAERCLYGVDLNPLAVELAKLSIWLVTLAKGRPFGFLDHNLRCGDGLLGITSLDQLVYLDIASGNGSSKKLFATEIDKSLARAIELRSEIRSHRILDIRDVEIMTLLNESARETIAPITLAADAFIGEVLSQNGKNFDATELSIHVGGAIAGEQGSLSNLTSRAKSALSVGLHPGANPRRTLHWPLEFPEVFLRDNGGFDAIVGNPPFVTGKRISTFLGTHYQLFLKKTFSNSTGAADLCVYFLRRANTLVRKHGIASSIATKSIAEGDSRSVGLEWLTKNGSKIVWAVHEVPWPGKASVTVSLVALYKGNWNGEFNLNGDAVGNISNRLSKHDEPDAIEPKPLAYNRGRCTRGIVVLGNGFLIDEAERLVLLSDDPRNADVIKPYITGMDIVQELGSQPSGWIISFGIMPQSVASSYEAPFRRLEQLVKDYRDGLTGQIHEKDFWKFWDKREEFFSSMRGKGRILACSRTSKYLVMSFIDESWIPSDGVGLFQFNDYSSFAIMQSNIHETWARHQSGKLEQRLTYNFSKAFATFPWPNASPIVPVAEEFYLLRGRYCHDESLCLTDFYNTVHDETKNGALVGRLRSQIAEIDIAVMESYGWQDLQLKHGFYDVTYLARADCRRFTICEEARREILRRLTKLNSEQYSSTKSTRSSASASVNLFSIGLGD